MTLIAPSTDIYLLKLPIELDDANQLTFANATAQYNYFFNLQKIALNDGTYQRREKAIRFDGLIDSIIEYNYCMYKNSGHGNKWFYARIKNMVYVGDSLTLVEIEEDAFQTWQFSLQYNQCFVEREHVSDDTIGANTIGEGLELGEYTINSSTTLKPDKLTQTDSSYGTPETINRIYPIFFQVSKLATGISIAASRFENSYNGVFSGLYFFAVTSEAAARWVIERYAQSGNSQDDIISIFLAPKEFLQRCFKFGELAHDIYIPKNQNGISHLLDSTTVSRPSSLDGYTPKNNKMFCWPFSLVSVTNNAGIDTEFRFEDFASATPKFFIGGAIGQGCSTKLCPIDYKKSASGAERFDYGVPGAKYPICAWATDYYTNWCTQNSVNISTGLVSGILGTGANLIGDAMTASVANSSSFIPGLGVAGAAISIGTQVAGIMAQNYEAKVHPNQAQGAVNSSDLLIGWQRYFTVNCMSLRYEMARSIDEYLSAFGYKVNRVKTPNITGRPNWNYVKTVGSAVHGFIPQDSVDRINDMFDKGVTLWHNPATFLDYSQNNQIA